MKHSTLAVLLTILGSAAIALLVLTYGIYFWTFGDQPLGSQDKWGQFGDFVGGTLNPLLAFLSLLALLVTLLVQTRQLEISKEELTLSRQELAATREELQRSADAQVATASALSKQAELAATSARISALSAALQATDEAMSRRLASQGGEALAELDYGGHTARRATLWKELEHLMRTLQPTAQQ